MACTGGRRWARRGGVTFGNVYVTRADRASEQILRHERRHANQWAVMGPLFIPSYGAWSGMSSALHRVVRRRGCSAGYACYNPYEIHAGLKDGGYRS